jgi:NADPH-dependent curcumin reductase CurA
MESTQFVFASRPSGLPTQENFRMEKINLEELKENEALLKPLFISVDPYMRGRMNDAKSYAASWQLGQTINGGVVAKVLESKSNSLSKGDFVLGQLPWATLIVEKADKLRKIDAGKFPSEYYLGILGMPGLTAYFGMTDICKPVKGETVVVSGAAGAVGLVAGQIAKIYGARVIGIAGSDDKCRLIREEYGFDEAINYKTSKSVRKELATLCPEGVDAYFDNVGGEITEAVIANLDFNSRIALCGQISQYSSTRLPAGNFMMSMLLTRSVLLKGFIVTNYSDRFPEGQAKLSAWLEEGRLKFTCTIIEGFEKLPEAFLGLFSGKNVGKMVVRVED